MTEPSTSDTRRPSPHPRANATATSAPIWPAEPVQVIPVEPSDELPQLQAFRAGVASALGVDSLEHEQIRSSLDRLVHDHGLMPLAAQRAFDTIEHLPCVGMCPGRQVDKPDEWCSFCTAKQALADALAVVGPAAVHVVHRDGELLHAALDADSARQWAAEATQDGLTFTTLEIQ